jgi:hypothetical protein
LRAPEIAGDIDADVVANRIKKRNEAVDNLMEKDFYKDNQDIEEGKTPPMPDPYDTSIKKRPWEEKIAECRCAWRRIDAVRKLVLLGFDEQSAAQAWNRNDEDLKAAASSLRRQKLVALFGCSRKQAVAALKKTNDDMNAAGNILLENR